MSCSVQRHMKHSADSHRGVSALLSCGSMAAARKKNCYTLQKEYMLSDAGMTVHDPVP
jgi:hypothetical protein